MLKILHIAAHYGGGVGSVVGAWVKHDSENTHTLTYLNNTPENEQPGHILFDPCFMEDADIVVCHVWNHPALFKFLVTCPAPACRMVGWSHMSGLHAPYVLFDKLVDYFDEFIYTSPISNHTGIHKEYIWSTCDSSEFLKIEKTPHDGFNVGYIGTLDYCKLHPEFIDICESIDIPGVKFIVVGDGCDFEGMKDEIIKRRIGSKFIFTGLIPDVRPMLSLFDVFLYPLYDRHFGTCEQVLGEAMAAGVPCVALNNPAERFILDYGKCGSICNSTGDIPGVVRRIYEGRGINTDAARDRARKLYSTQNKISRWNCVFDRIMQQPKRLHSWNNIFLESIGDIGAMFRKGDREKIQEIFSGSNQWKSKSKGSVKQYADYFPYDKYLQELAKLL
jgi:L-malate glycosyltransferase